MAAWNEKNDGDELEECNICLCQVAKKRLTVHLNKCIQTHQLKFDTEEMGFLMKCPLYPNHIIPKSFINHHLEFDCEEASNLLRKFFQKEDLRKSNRFFPPKSFLKDIPSEILNDNNKRLLYLLQTDFNGKSLVGDTNLYPDGSPKPSEDEPESSTSGAHETPEEAFIARTSKQHSTDDNLLSFKGTGAKLPILSCAGPHSISGYAQYREAPPRNEKLSSSDDEVN